MLEDKLAIEHLRNLLSLTEKRAEEAERKLTAEIAFALKNKSRVVEAIERLEKQLTTVESERERASLRISLARVVEALKPFAEEAESYEEDVRDDLLLTVAYEDGTMGNTVISVGDLRKARALHRSQGE